MSQLDSDIQEVESQVTLALSSLNEAATPEQIRELEIKFLGKKGVFNEYYRRLRQLDPDEKRAFGEVLNKSRGQVEERIQLRSDLVASSEAETAKIDVTFEGVVPPLGRIHPVSKVQEELKRLLSAMGFSFSEYPVIEDEAHNFDALNTPSWHPARDMHDPFSR